ncbi:hypothetical protein P43SY_004683 [Pythium insidiosum]|uniref:Uncharacterized protein n=1 Tax=Pythium insidiosum TaxID=114742 RepID=A0AAD5Q583_PYTIN|nr:hypothetical protein P43SY_004683 [Pythium insidiosum]
MPLRLDIKRKLNSRSERVKSVDFHPTEPWVLSALYSGSPWVLSALYSGSVMIWNYDTQSLVKTIEVSGSPVRNAKFVARKQWIITSSDDMQVRVFNYNTLDKVTAFEAHPDFIRHVEVHPTLPCFLTCADDMNIKLWDWDKGFACKQVFEGHGHYVMMAKFNPKDTNTFATEEEARRRAEEEAAARAALAQAEAAASVASSSFSFSSSSSSTSGFSFSSAGGGVPPAAPGSFGFAPPAPVATTAAPASNLLDFELENEMNFDDDDADWGEM